MTLAFTTLRRFNRRTEIDMRKLFACLVLACFALGSSAGFAQVPDKCKNLKGDEQKKCIDDAKGMKK
jgi:hypothetical protein